MGRLKTGTPPRLKADTINYTKCQVQKGDDPSLPFSFMNDSVWIDVGGFNSSQSHKDLKSETFLQPKDQLKCYLTFTTTKIEDIVRNNIHLNRHVFEEVTGPRYCPSIESKVLKFGGREHQLWLEPEGLNSNVIYPNGKSALIRQQLI